MPLDIITKQNTNNTALSIFKPRIKNDDYLNSSSDRREQVGSKLFFQQE
jgi:hypothetical protein